MHSKSGWNHFVIPGILVGIVLGACTYEAPTSGNPSGAGGTNQVASSSSGSGTSSVSSGQGGTGGQTNSSSSGDIVSSSSSSTGSSSSSSGDPGSSSSGMGTSSSSSASSSGGGLLGVDCGGSICKADLFCCELSGSLSCNDPMLCETLPTFFCDGKEDCNGMLCCMLDTTAACKFDCTVGTVICNDSTDCPNQGQCDTTKYGTIGECK